MVLIAITAITLAGAVSAVLALVVSQLRQRQALPEEEAPQVQEKAWHFVDLTAR